MRMMMIAAVTLAAGIAGDAVAQGAKVSSPAELARKAEMLKPGEWVWAPAISPAGPVLVYVDLSRQIATVYRNGVRIGVATISSGKPGHETPTGVFTILQKDAKHRSIKYNSAPMPYQQRLTWDGVALHAGGLPGYPESHGCVHLPFEFSRELFGITTLGATVVIQGNAARHIQTSPDGVIAPFDAKGHPAPGVRLGEQPFIWRPELSPAGPVTIIVSKSDKRVIVLRNGVEIGRSVAALNDDDPGTHVITMIRARDGSTHWSFVGLPGHSGEENLDVDAAVINRLKLPGPFYANVRAIVAPGTTILITQAPVGTAPGERMTIMDGVRPEP